jgi:RNA polymerase sigma-70 factor (ECF subfamily)
MAISRLSASQPRAAASGPALALVRDDCDCVERVPSGDVAAFEQLFVQYYEPLVGFAYVYVKSKAVAEEIVQDVMVRIWERGAAWQVEGSVASYLYRAVRNGVLNHGRAERRARKALTGGELALAGPRWAPHADDRAETAELLDQLRAALDTLPEGCRQVYLLSRQHGLCYREIAGALGISVKGVETQIGRALKRLKERLSDCL